MAANALIFPPVAPLDYRMLAKLPSKYSIKGPAAIAAGKKARAEQHTGITALNEQEQEQQPNLTIESLGRTSPVPGDRGPL